jgi:cellulose biosynthesis protein BcsQ/biotin operon repressor
MGEFSVQAVKLAKRCQTMLSVLTEDIERQKIELDMTNFYKTYSKAQLASMPFLSRNIVNFTVQKMEADGYKFKKRKQGSSLVYCFDIEDVVNIYEFREVPKYRDRHKKALVLFITGLKGGISKTVSTVNLAHATKTHDHLIKEDMRILVIDLDPQASATMFLKSSCAIGQVDHTSVQAMIQNVSLDELKKNYIKNTQIPGVDVIPSSIDDAFISSNWESLVSEHLPNQNPNAVLKENIIEKVNADYDLILIDCGPILDSLLKNALVATDIISTPISPSTVDFHSTLKYLVRLPELIMQIEETGVNVNIKHHLAFLTKIHKSKLDHQQCINMAKEIFGVDLLDAAIPKLDPFERSGESFDTVVTVDPKHYVGSREAIQNAKAALNEFAISVFNRIEFYRNDGGF